MSLKTSSRLGKIIRKDYSAQCAHTEILEKLLGIFQDLLSFEDHALGLSNQLN